MKKISLGLLIISVFLFADKFEEMKKIEENIFLQTKEIDLTGVQNNYNAGNFEENLSKIYNEVAKNVDVETKRIQGEDVSLENMSPIENININKKEQTLSFLKNSRVYIFMSESVPLDIWKTYGTLMHEKKLENTNMVLRGCIGGSCANIQPTINFMLNLFAKDEKNKMSPNVIIDPLLFRKYDIKQAPCVVFAENAQTKNVSVSEGLDDNFNSKNIYKSCGAWSLVWHLKELNKRANSEDLKQMINYLEPKGGI